MASPTTPSRGPWVEVVTALALGCTLVAGALWWANPSEEKGSRQRPITLAGALLADPRYVGSTACRECHPGEHAFHTTSGHAQTLRRAGSLQLAARLNGRETEDPDQTGVTWRYRREDGQLIAERRASGRVERYPLEFALGSGQHAVTFLTRLDRGRDFPEGLEHRLTYFAHDDQMGLTPGQGPGTEEADRSPGGARLAAKVLLDCLECHGTPTARPKGGIDVTTLVPNVTCERCHGPGREHVESARTGRASPNELAMPFGPGRASGPEQVALCGHCHRLPEMVPPETVRTDNLALARFPSVGLVQSACFQGSRGVLTCTTCHDPHGRANKPAEAYEATCRKCHGPDRDESGPAAIVQKARACSVQPRSGCIDCHMPRRDVGHGMTFSDHWVRVHADLP